MRADDTPFGGHLGVARTYEQLQRLFTWAGAHDDVETFVRTCHGCQRNKSVHTGPKGLLQPLSIPGRRWESVSLDFITALVIIRVNEPFEFRRRLLPNCIVSHFIGYYSVAREF